MEDDNTMYSQQQYNAFTTTTIQCIHNVLGVVQRQPAGEHRAARGAAVPVHVVAVEDDALAGRRGDVARHVQVLRVAVERHVVVPEVVLLLPID